MDTVKPSKSVARNQILEVASELFYKDGIRAVGVDTIIARAGVAKMTFYKHFRSKDLLIVEIIEDRSERWRSWFQSSVLNSSTSSRERLLNIFDVLEDKLCKTDFRGCAFINTMIEIADRNHLAHQASAKHKQLVQQFIHFLLEDMGVEDPDTLSRQFMLLIDGAIVTSVRENSTKATRAAKKVAEKLLSE